MTQDQSSASHAPREEQALCSCHGCERRIHAKRLCFAHYARLRRGIPLDRPMVRRNMATRVVPARYVLKSGYVTVIERGHPNANATGSILEHRLVMSQMLGRALLPGESVHHKNGVRHDNRRKNLELRVSHPKGQSVPDTIRHAEEMLRRYAPHRLTTKGALWDA